MKYFSALCLVLFSLSGFSQEFKISDWFNEKANSVVQLSPDGKLVAWLTYNNRILIQPIDKGASRSIQLSAGQRFIDGQFINDEKFVYVVQDGDEYRVISHYLPNATQKLLYTSRFFKVSLAQEHRKSEVVWLIVNGQLKPFDLLSRSLGKAVPLPKNSQFVGLANNKPCYSISDTKDVFILKENEWKKFEPVESISQVYADKDCHNFWILATHEKNTKSLFRVTSKKSELIYSQKYYDIADVIFDSNKKNVAAVFYEAELLQVKTFSKNAQKIDSIMQRSFPKSYWQVIAQSVDGKKSLVSVQSPKIPPQVIWTDVETNRVVSLQRRLQNYDKSRWYKTSVVSVDNGAKPALFGYLTQPDKLNSHVPLIIRIHGGPFEIRDRWRFDPEAQWLADQGLATLTFNYRGSSGMGNAYRRVAYGDLRSVIEEDIEEILTALESQFNYDPVKRCLYGASFGGYAVLSELISNSDDYVCGIMVSSVVSLPMFYESLSDEMTKATFAKQFGNYDDPDWREENNLLLHLGEIDATTLVIYGNQDKRVSPLQSEALIAKMKILKKPFTVKKLENSDHEIEVLEDRLAVYKSIQQFLQEHLLKSLK
ncbi:alpha/beta hydrolase family protein [Pleionea sediminis]|uniref:alpha/beta hydrolase family protein n=1 Tax=Pleionea sediminis TaxID=2569479 RepID=UPI0013DE1E6B|nr:prolyl oligopeptidase family serine peptidase [Pleionea sediminis]